MLKLKSYYLIMLAIIICFIVYVIYMNFIYDPQAASFLDHKLNKKFNAPVWLNVMYVHILCACLAMVSGAVNFSQTILRKYRKLHKMNGYVYVAAVIIVDVTSGYMAPYATGGKAVSIAFNLLNIVWPIMTVIAIMKIRKKQVQAHRKWMTRSYAFCFTNLIIHTITYVLHDGIGIGFVTSYTSGVYGSLLLLPVIAEIINIKFHSSTPTEPKFN
ncbi:DUF2306 domain-containing protein [Paenibacillus periandrae]|uniref:DUF2306 domain-containing protein n=1 Tax=Paenibacillus periandrae TaxID=1761741 RepID=UPI001F08BC62|nr:DUF2306 domain-containing protein [Paenibacillus periandrae]